MSAVALNQGMDSVLSASGSPKNVILVGKGSEESIERSEIHLDAESSATTSIRGLEKSLGIPAVSGEILVHTSVRLREGHFPASGEVIVGTLAHRNLGVTANELVPGKTIYFEDEQLHISGIFEAPGTVLESEIWFDRNDLASLTQRDTLSAITLRLGDAQLADVEVFTLQRNDLELAAISENKYYDKLSTFYQPIKVMTWVTAALVSAGALFGGLNTLYAAFASRIREMATLQSIGYTRTALLISLVQESLLATLSGTLLAFLIAYFLLDGQTVPFSIGTFTLSLNASVILIGLITGIILGTIGTLPPAIRCLAPSLPKALRSS